jgi:hypothetical protein
VLANVPTAGITKHLVCADNDRNTNIAADKLRWMVTATALPQSRRTPSRHIRQTDNAKHQPPQRWCLVASMPMMYTTYAPVCGALEAGPLI